MQHCPNMRLVMVTEQLGAPLHLDMVRVRCKQWSCPYCAKANQKMWRAFLAGQLPIVSGDWWHVTLTAHSRMRSEQASYKNLQHGIDVLLKRMRRVFGKIEYVRVFEKHPTSNALHCHLAVSALTPFVIPGCHKNLQHGYLSVTSRSPGDGSWSIRTWTKKTSQECQIGYQADVRQAANAGLVWYVTKYLTKVSQQINIKGLRHVATSRRVGSPDKSGAGAWDTGRFITALDVTPDEKIRDIQTGDVLSYRHLVIAGVYPPPAERNDLSMRV